MYLEEALFFDFIPPTQNPIGFSLISHFRCAHMTGTGINRTHGIGRNGWNCPESWPVRDALSSVPLWWPARDVSAISASTGMELITMVGGP
jgi:hypothetical protein